MGAFGGYFGGLGGSWRTLEAILAHLGPKRALKSAPEAPHPRYGVLFGDRLGVPNFPFWVKKSTTGRPERSETDFFGVLKKYLNIECS